MNKDFSDFRKYLSKHGSEIDAAVESKLKNHSSSLDKSEKFRIESHYEAIELLEHYHKWLNS